MDLLIAGFMLGVLFGAICQKWENDNKRQALELIIRKQNKKINQLKLTLNRFYGLNKPQDDHEKNK